MLRPVLDPAVIPQGSQRLLRDLPKERLAWMLQKMCEIRYFEEKVVLRPIMQMTLSADHRVVDGAGAARFLTEVKRVLENPYLLI